MKLTPCILMRASRYEEDELTVASEFFPVYRHRSEIPAGSLVVGRYSNLPYHRELEHDVRNLGSQLINTSAQHSYVADLDYYEDLSEVTFKTWFRPQDVPSWARDKPFVVKGRTNSRKQSWSQLMFAENFVQANRIAAELRCDGLLGQQGIIMRQFVPLETFEVSPVNGLPFSNEWRLFYYKGKLLAHGYYWSSIDDWSPVEAARSDFESAGVAFANEVAARLVDKVPFVVIDIAKTKEGQWVVVELNDGCQAGLNDSVSARDLYCNLKVVLSAEASEIQGSETESLMATGPEATLNSRPAREPGT